ncbi:MAG TPA: PucR family transcriptional regulator ligand-binding domain-containing protein [Streptosporangiaceae bacterium]|jgi:purine catabolism regulator
MRDTADAKLDQPITVAGLLADAVMAGAELVAGRAGVGRTINAVNVMSVPEIGRWVRTGEFLLATGYPLPRDDEGQARLLEDLHDLGVSGIGIKLDRYMSELSDSMTDVAEELGMPLVVIPERVRFDDILSRTFTKIVNQQAAALERAQEIHNSFLDISLSGGGLSKLAGRLSALLGGAGVVVTDPQGGIRATAGDPDPLAGLEPHLGADSGFHTDERTGRRWAARQIRAGDLRHGFVVVAEGAAPFGEFGLVALDQAAIVAALEITRDLAVGTAERRFSSNALFELITGGESEFADAATRGATFGWDLDRDVVVLVGRKEVDDDQRAASKRQSRLAGERAIEFWTSAVHGHDRGAAAAGLGAELVAVVGAGQDAVAVARAIQSEVARFTQGRYAIGVSRAYQGSVGIPAAYQEAKMALRLGHRVSGPGAVTAYGDLGLFRLLAQVADDELRTFVGETLGPLLRLNEPERSEMLGTLEAMVEHNMNMAETARHMHYHYNTLRYRLTKLEGLLGPFSTNTAVTIRVCVALQIMDMQSRTTHRTS